MVGSANAGNVLANDTLNGVALVPSAVSVTSVPNGPVTINADGTVSIAPNTAAGSYTATYTVCEILNPSNCSTGTVTVVVAAAVIVANDDDYLSIPLNGLVGGIVGAVTTNDTLNGVAVNVTQVVISILNTDGINGLTLNSNGNINIPANIAEGTYLIEYQICEVLNPTNCDNAFVSVLIGGCLDFPENDCDGDGVTNGQEALDGTDPSDSCDLVVANQNTNPEFSWFQLDCDGDGVTNEQEIQDGTDPLNSCVFVAANVTLEQSQAFLDGDCDGDGLTNGQEIGNNPNTPNDSNGNGIPDYLEVNNHSVASDDLEVFNLVTPNGDGDNDVFVIRNIESYPNNSVEIYNRWGVKVYETKGYGQNGQYFRGISEGRATISQSSELPVGAYFYIIRYENLQGITRERSGYLYINK